MAATDHHPVPDQRPGARESAGARLPARAEAEAAWEPAGQPLMRPSSPSRDDRTDQNAGDDRSDRSDGSQRRRWRRRRPLPLRTRIAFWVVGVLLLLLGIAGLVLPGLQGILLLIFGAAVLSLASERLYRWLEQHMADRAPRLWRRLERFRTRVRWRFRAPPSD